MAAAVEGIDLRCRPRHASTHALKAPVGWTLGDYARAQSPCSTSSPLPMSGRFCMGLHRGSRAETATHAPTGSPTSSDRARSRLGRGLRQAGELRRAGRTGRIESNPAAAGPGPLVRTGQFQRLDVAVPQSVEDMVKVRTLRAEGFLR
jgi:hypothetical protein